MAIKSMVMNPKYILWVLGGVFLVNMVLPGLVGPNYENAVSTGGVVTFTLVLVWLIATVAWLIISGAITKTKKTVGQIKTAGLNRQMKQRLLEALADDTITDEEMEELEKAKDELGVSDADFQRIRSTAFRDAIQPMMKKIMQSKRFSPDDEKAMLEIARNHKVQASFASDLTIYRQLWEIANTGQFTPVPLNVDIRLNQGEECFFQAGAIWKQTRKYRKNMGYVGGSVGVRVAKGVTLRVGRAVPTYKEYEGIETLSSGRLYVTNKRILFVGDKKSTTITMGRLVDYELFRDAVLFTKSSGKPDIFQTDEDSIQILDALLQVI